MIVVIFAKFSHVDLPTPGEEDSIRWYINICLRKVCEAWSAYLPNDGACSLLLHHNNASAHTSAITLDYMETNRIQLVTQTLYSPGLAPWVFFLLTQMKQLLKGKLFQGINYAQAFLKGVICDMPLSMWSGAMIT